MAVARELVERTDYTEDEYYDICRLYEGRWEYFAGRIRMMAGGTQPHSLISGSLYIALYTALTPRGCRVYNSDMRVRTGDGLITFPDISAVCGEHEFPWGRDDALLNPVLLVDVLSRSTAVYDRGEKFEHYRTIPALRDYLLVEQSRPAVRLHSWADEAADWTAQDAVGLAASVTLPSVGLTLRLADLYALIEFPDEAAP